MKTKMKMKTKRFHGNNLGQFQPRGLADTEGYITIHDSPVYGEASESELNEFANSRSALVRAAALVELAERAIREWRG